MKPPVRIIPRLDIKGPNLVKGIHLEGLRVLGKPEQFARHYYESGADELMYVDVVASLYDRNSLQDIISRTAREIFIPLTVGGGLRTIDDIKNVLKAGADKVSLNTAVVKNPQVIREASKVFGSSTIVVMIEAIKQPDGSYLAYVDNGRQYTGIDVVEWAERVEELGAGEIVITSVDREGTGLGFDMELSGLVCEKVSIPVIVHGGVGKLEHLREILEIPGVDAISIASILHYDFIRHNRVEFEPGTEGNIEFLKSGKTYNVINSHNLREIKEYLHRDGIPCRYESE